MGCVKWLLAAAVLVLLESSPAFAEEDRVLPPMAFTLFCKRLPAECSQRMGTQETRTRLDYLALWHDLNLVNTAVNTSITPVENGASEINLNWQIFPVEDNCADYAVTKRHLLLNAGWASSALLLAEVVVRKTGEHHLVLIVKKNGDYLVLDNRKPAIVKLIQALRDYNIVRAQSDESSKFWTRRLT